ncbi:MAG: cytochrome c oxidase assembly protein [Chromatiales bacterium]
MAEVSDQGQGTRRTVRRLLFATVAMFGFGYALVPLYDVFCTITGVNGKTGRVSAEQASAQRVDTNRLVTVQFTTATNTGLPWEFKPVVNELQVHPGEVKEVEFVARNQSNRAMTGQAVPSVAPGSAARFFKKTECFCFTRQHLAAREEKRMPVRFVVDPALPKTLGTLTLSYTFFSVPETASAD